MPCGLARGVTEEDFEGIDARFISPAELIDLTMEADKVLTF